MTIVNPCALLKRLVTEPEKEWIEFKKDNCDPEMIAKYVSGLANAAMLADQNRAFLVFGINNETRERVGTTIRFDAIKKGGENFPNWLTRMIEPRLMIEYLNFECDEKNFAILVIEPSYDRPVRFSGTEYVRVGENLKKLSELPQHERALWLATGRRKFEDAVAMPNVSEAKVFELLDTNTLYRLTGDPVPASNREIIRRLSAEGLVIDNLQDGYDITNLGACLFAKDVKEFPSIAHKSVRIIKYAGQDKRKSEQEQEGGKGYAVGFSGMIKFILNLVPQDEVYVEGIRRSGPVYPEIAIREVIANALTHQDFTVSGTGPVVEIYANRIEITNPGSSLIEPDRMLDERRSRNEKLASTMRTLGLCEERGGGLDKTIIEIEERHLPAPEFISSNHSMRVVLFGPRTFSEMSKQEKLRACFFHSVLRWMNHDYMSNTSLRERFSLEQSDYQAVSTIISEAVRTGRIAPADPSQGKRNARYVPYWAA